MDQGSKPAGNEMRAGPSSSTMMQGSSTPCSLLNRTAMIGLIVAIGFAVFLGIYLLNPPDPAPPNAPLTEFSSGRAMKHLQVIAVKPHPMGSPEHANVRDYILHALIAMGLSPEVQTTTVVNHRGTAKGDALLAAGTVHNIVARLKGTAHRRAILLAAHYDSVPTGPGASDDGAAVAAMLETLRALSASAPLMNDVIFLFTDGEEAGLLVLLC
jgi:acetylornithine deacetylase/succinyl-diaminopimelate desuccinylase-like protein